jgi:hypothetical protein
MPHDVIEIFGGGVSQVEVITTDENIVEVVVPGPQGPMATIPASIQYVFDGGDDQVDAGMTGNVVIPFACSIVSWTLVAEPLGDIVIDVWRSSYAGFPASVSDSITGGEKPSIVSGQKASSSSLGAWDVEIQDGDILTFHVDFASGVLRASVSLKVIRA